MPFAWTAIWLQNIIKGKDALQGDLYILFLLNP
jgi:hypothetical protein